MSEYKRLTGKDGATRVMSQWSVTSNDLKIYRRLAELEDKIENGTLVETPKIGQTMYGFSVREQLIEFTVVAITIDSQYNIIVWDYDDNDFVIGENGFYSFEQAQAKLKELQEKQK